MLDSIVYEMQADFCKSMSHPGRQRIVHLLFEGPKNVNEISSSTGLCQSGVSRHLATLRQSGIVISERRGQEIFYELANLKIIEVCELMRSILLSQMSENSTRARQLQEKIQ